MEIKKTGEEQGTEKALQERAKKDMGLLLEDLKQRRRRGIYRLCLCAALLVSCLGLLGAGYYSLYQKVPSVIRIRAGMEQSIDLNVPMKAQVVSASEQGSSNIPAGAVTIDLNSEVILKADELKDYSLDVRLFGFLPFKQVGVQVIEDQELVPVGVPIGIYVKTDGILVIGVGEFTGADGRNHSPARYILQSGDYIREIDGEPVSRKDDFIQKVEESGGREVVLKVERTGELTELRLKPVKNQSGDYRLGVWVRDNAQGVGTMTFIDAEGNFGALGHGINDVDTSTLMNSTDGTLYQTEIVSIKKGKAGKPGEMTGMIVYSSDRILGDITSNNVQGIFGVCNEKALALTEEKPIPIALKQELHTGSAQILCTVDGSAAYYDVEITALHLDHDNVNRGIELKVTDPKLLSVTGGIVQGMSGAPIIQDGKFAGAVTHVLVNNPTSGYGIFIENMLEH